MIAGQVTAEGVPTCYISVDGRNWAAVIDTGFNGYLELPIALQGHLNDRYRGEVRSQLAGGQEVVEDCFLVDFPFDGEIQRVPTTYAPGDEILIGTRLLYGYRLEIDFTSRVVRLERAS